MNANRLISMILRRVMGRAVSRGVDHAARGGRRMEEMTPEERKRARQLSKGAKGARRAVRMARRIGRF